MREKVFISVIDPEGRINKSEISVRNARTISLGRELVCISETWRDHF